MITPQPSTPSEQSRNRAATRRNWVRVEQHLMDVERDQGCAKSLELRGRLERGEITLGGSARR
jgi:hypothetical protein